MKLPRFHFTIRGLMLAIAIVAVLIAAGVLTQRTLKQRTSFLQRAAQNRVRAREIRLMAASSLLSAERTLREAEAAAKAGPRHSPLAEYLARDAAYMRDSLQATILVHVPHWQQEADYYDELSRKYRRAASRPWLSVSPDPAFYTRDPQPSHGETAANVIEGARVARRRVAFLEQRIAQRKERRDLRVPRWEAELAFEKARVLHDEEVARLFGQAAVRPNGAPPVLPTWPPPRRFAPNQDEPKQ